MQRHAIATLSLQDSQKTWEEIIRACQDEGLNKPVPLQATLRIISCAGLLSLTTAFCWQTGSLLYLVIGTVVISLCMSQLAFWGHNAGHEAITKQRFWNKLLGQVSMTVFCGLAFEEWRDRHRSHHRYVQEDGVDPDMLIDFVASVTVESKRSKSALGRKLCRWQHVYVWMLSLLFGHSQRFQSQWGALRQAQKYKLDLMTLGLHYCLFVILPFVLGLAVDRILLIYLLPTTILGPHLAAVFWVNHIGKPLIEQDIRIHNFEQQVITARTIDNPPGWDWFFGGLNFQIEHHIYPAVPSIKLRSMQRVVRPIIEQRQLNYDSCSWFKVIKEVYQHFRYVANADLKTPKKKVR